MAQIDGIDLIDIFDLLDDNGIDSLAEILSGNEDSMSGLLVTSREKALQAVLFTLSHTGKLKVVTGECTSMGEEHHSAVTRSLATH